MNEKENLCEVCRRNLNNNTDKTSMDVEEVFCLGGEKTECENFCD